MSLPRLFFAFGALCLLVGMGWGIHMSASGDHALAPAHAHLNLVGFVLASIFGGWYALAPSAQAGIVGRIHLGVHALAVVIMVPGIVWAIQDTGETAAKIGSVLAILSALTFLVQVLRHPIAGRA